MDAYRLDSTPEAAELDLDEMLSRGSLLVEWPERIDEILPDKRIWITLEYVAEEHRHMLMKAVGERYDALLTELRQALVGGD